MSIKWKPVEMPKPVDIGVEIVRHTHNGQLRSVMICDSKGNALRIQAKKPGEALEMLVPDIPEPKNVFIVRCSQNREHVDWRECETREEAESEFRRLHRIFDQDDVVIEIVEEKSKRETS